MSLLIIPMFIVSKRGYLCFWVLEGKRDDRRSVSTHILQQSRVSYLPKSNIRYLVRYVHVKLVRKPCNHLVYHLHECLEPIQITAATGSSATWSSWSAWCSSSSSNSRYSIVASTTILK